MSSVPDPTSLLLALPFSSLFSLFFSIYPSLLVTDGNLFVSPSHIDIITSYISVKENHWAGHACSN